MRAAQTVTMVKFRLSTTADYVTRIRATAIVAADAATTPGTTDLATLIAPRVLVQVFVYTRKSMPREIYISRRGGNVTVQPNTAQWNTLSEFTGQRFRNDTSRWYRSVGSTLQTRMLTSANAKYGQDTKIHMYTNG